MALFCISSSSERSPLLSFSIASMSLCVSTVAVFFLFSDRSPSISSVLSNSGLVCTEETSLAISDFVYFFWRTSLAFCTEDIEFIARPGALTPTPPRRPATVWFNKAFPFSPLNGLMPWANSTRLSLSSKFPNLFSCFPSSRFTMSPKP